jgi:hypothetical protein
MSKKEEVLLPDAAVMGKIYVIRGEQVMLDKDLAELYGVETKALKQAVKRNIDIFPIHFMFELTKSEYDSLRSQFVTSNVGRGGTRYLPMAFTEYGILQVANAVRSQRARHMSVKIIEVLVRMRKVFSVHEELLYELEEIRKKVLSHDEKLELIFDYVAKFETEERFQNEPRPEVGFKQRGNK